MLLKYLDLQRFPVDAWEEEPSSRWMDLCRQMPKHHHKVPSIDDHDSQRKWEFVSAYQKCVRRGLSDWAIRLLGGFQSIIRSQPAEKSYFWKRICTTACEDVGYGDPELMNFVLACSMIFTPSKVTDEQLLKIWSFLSKEMCRIQRSRIYCQLSIIEELLRRGEQPATLDGWESVLITKILTPVRDTLRQKWAEKNNWRGEGMVKFQHLAFDVQPAEDELKPFETIGGLPDFTYDMHTRVGTRVLRFLSEHPPFRQFLEKHRSKLGSGKTLGWSLFFCEGGSIQNRLYDPRFDLLEAKFIAHQFGWHLREWRRLVKLMEEAVSDGTVNNLRKNIVACMPYSEADGQQPPQKP
jgi:hypothetical protein